MFKACSRCGKIHPANYNCTAGRVYRGGEERKLRAKYAWEKKSKEVRAKADYLCEVCRDQGIYSYNNVEVHHIEKLKDAPEMLLEDSNLVCLCTKHHKDADAGLIDKAYLSHLAGIREKR